MIVRATPAAQAVIRDLHLVSPASLQKAQRPGSRGAEMLLGKSGTRTASKGWQCIRKLAGMPPFQCSGEEKVCHLCMPSMLIVAKLVRGDFVRGRPLTFECGINRALVSAQNPIRWGELSFMSEDILMATLSENVVDSGLDSFDSVAWQLATVLCRSCWHPWWMHGHGPFTVLVDQPTAHLFDAL